MSDAVNHPNHYMLFADGTEAIDVIREVLDHDEFIGYCKGNILKYRLRAGKKDALQQDIDKAETYARMLAEALELPAGPEIPDHPADLGEKYPDLGDGEDEYLYPGNYQPDPDADEVMSCHDQRHQAGEDRWTWGCNGCINVTCESNVQFPGTSD